MAVMATDYHSAENLASEPAVSRIHIAPRHEVTPIRNRAKRIVLLVGGLTLMALLAATLMVPREPGRPMMSEPILFTAATYSIALILALNRNTRFTSWVFLASTLVVITMGNAASGMWLRSPLVLIILLLPHLASMILAKKADWFVLVGLLLLTITAITWLEITLTQRDLRNSIVLASFLAMTVAVVAASLMAYVNRTSYDEALEMLDERARFAEMSLAKIVQQERMVALGRMAASISHQINNPLQVVIFALDTYLTEEREAAHDLVSLARRHLGLMNGIVDTLSAFVRPASFMKRQLVDVNESVSAAVSLSRTRITAEHVTLKISLDGLCPLVHAPPSEIIQIVAVLMDNALDAMAEVDHRVMEIVTHSMGSHVQITVSDTGPGVDPEVGDTLFEPFVTTKGEGGTGLGLFIVYNIAAGLGGEVDYLNKQDKQGAVFYFRIPAARGMQ